MKNKDFIDWFSENFGYGYGDGELHIIPKLKGFLESCPEEGNYDYTDIEEEIGQVATWFLMNTLCETQMLDYGTSPRFGWLDQKGRSLKNFLSKFTSEELYTMVMVDADYTHCYSDACNCGPQGYEQGRRCDNPLFL